MKKMSRMEANKCVRRILNRHSVDLANCYYSVAGHDIRLSGWLCKNDASDFNGTQIESIIQEFQNKLNGYSISGEFDNWRFTSEHISYIGEKKEVIKREAEIAAEAQAEEFDDVG